MADIQWRPRLKYYSSRDKKVKYIPDTEICISYSTRVGLVYPNRVLILTDYNYSRTTNSHYWRLINFFSNRNYTIYRIPCIVGSHGGLQFYLNETRKKIVELELSLKKKRSAWRIENLKDQIKLYMSTVKFLEEKMLTEAIEEALTSV